MDELFVTSSIFKLDSKYRKLSIYMNDFIKPKLYNFKVKGTLLETGESAFAIVFVNIIGNNKSGISESYYF